MLKTQKTVRVLGVSKAQREAIVAAFTKDRYRILRGKEDETATVAVIGPAYVPKQGDSLATAANAKFPLVWRKGTSTGEVLRRFYSAHAYGCFFLRDFKNPEELSEETVQSAEDILFLSMWMSTWNRSGRAGLGAVLLDELDVGVSVLDRRFRIWYRNAKHRQMVPTKVGDCSLCWIAYHDLVPRVGPCIPCPAADLFKKGTVLDKPLYMAVGCGRNDSRNPRLTRVRAVPVSDHGRNGRIVGALELVYDVMGEMFQDGKPGFDSAIEGLLRTAFLQEYSRARLFMLTPDGQELVGHTSVVRDGVPQVPRPIASLRLPVNPPARQALPSPSEDHKTLMANVTLPEEPQIRDVRLMDPMEIYFAKDLDKDRAPVWGDLPVRNPSDVIVGKVVIDRWSKAGKQRPQSIRREDISGYEHALHLLGRLISEAHESQAARDRESVAAGVGEILNARIAVDKNTVFEILCKAVQRLHGVVSAMIRVPEAGEGGRYLTKVAGFGAYERHCRDSIAVSPDTISGAAFLNRRPSKVIASSPNTLLLARSIDEITPSQDREELGKVHFQRSYPIGQTDIEPVAVLSVLCSESKCLVDTSILILAAVTSASLSGEWLRQFNDDLLKCLLSVLELHDVDTAQHSIRVGEIAREIAKKISGQDPHRAYLAGCLHDIGKIGLSTGIIREHTLLTAGEWAYARVHVELARTILSGMPALQDVCLAAWEHHKWFDGSDGYPKPATEDERQRWGERISFLGRIVAVADCYEAMTSTARIYKAPLAPSDALTAILERRGTRFCPAAADAFEQAFGTIQTILMSLDKQNR